METMGKDVSINQPCVDEISKEQADPMEPRGRVGSVTLFVESLDESDLKGDAWTETSADSK